MSGVLQRSGRNWAEHSRQRYSISPGRGAAVLDPIRLGSTAATHRTRHQAAPPGTIQLDVSRATRGRADAEQSGFR